MPYLLDVRSRVQKQFGLAADADLGEHVRNAVTHVREDSADNDYDADNDDDGDCSDDDHLSSKQQQLLATENDQ